MNQQVKILPSVKKTERSQKNKKQSMIRKGVDKGLEAKDSLRYNRSIERLLRAVSRKFGDYQSNL